MRRFASFISASSVLHQTIFFSSPANPFLYIARQSYNCPRLRRSSGVGEIREGGLAVWLVLGNYPPPTENPVNLPTSPPTLPPWNQSPRATLMNQRHLVCNTIHLDIRLCGRLLPGQGG